MRQGLRDIIKKNRELDTLKKYDYLLMSECKGLESEG